MNNLDKQYQSLLQDILDNGVEKKDRTGTGTISVFGRQIRHKMSDGFPLLTTKKMYFKGIVTELLWFLKGDTNIKYLVDNDCHIWDGDCFANYLKNRDRFSNKDNVKEDVVINGMNGSSNRAYTQEEFINKIKTDDEFAKKWGDLGPVYGKQWRSWAVPRMEPKGFDFDAAWKKHSEIWSANYGEECGPSFGSFCDSILINKNIGIAYGYHTEIDQIANLINDLKTNPDSRRLMVNAWNPAELDQAVLPPCHYGFQVYTRELSGEERMDLYDKSNWNKDIFPSDVSGWNRLLDTYNIPTRAISLMWNQRSVDTFLGLPFNIASYGLLLEIIANEVNMVPDELIGNLGDVHLYSNHIEQAKEQIGKISWRERKAMLTEPSDIKEFGDISPFTDKMIHYWLDWKYIPYSTRMPYPLPKLNINNLRSDTNSIIFDTTKWSTEDFILENYQSHPAIKAPLSN
jgi:thymidylate synthase